ncbi:MAG TPA: carboxynorspermidine decarboxylase [Methylomusa anaerophila]|uniref:Carboxynorspermidine/carboxyspermidine decarboxylase n=1 Tax=Methylomusa anaerophila TaxID=1930071 RepID=A0A348AGH4_9FIRM|nr:carboxynorspermidine decarboxylase [Methylomusa anaerophila]BBB90172.1 carboxynorspermidine/carboxyspermidine decarboxylase [Methylomusa anaerophila]HML88102.1 carboxynorspermidine decarboxylase [Methylomusa anaerophila]
MKIATPYYLIDEKKLLRNLQIIQQVRQLAGAKSVLALKCFSTWCVFDLMRKYMDGTTSSSLFEARLGFEKFGKETHAYCVGYSREDILAVAEFADKIIFNSVSQLDRYYDIAKAAKVGLRVNPGISYSHFDLADPARKYSRLGVTDKEVLAKQIPRLSGLMFHYNCENDDFETFVRQLDTIGGCYGDMLKQVQWVSLGGGLYFTKEGYPLEKFSKKLADFAGEFNVEIYLEPGESAITGCAELVTSVVDLVHNEMDIAIVDASVEGHMPDLLIYRLPAKIEASGRGDHNHKYMVAGRSCLAGDVFGTFHFKDKLEIGSEIRFADAAGYTMVKKNWFNGLQMPAVAVRRLDGTIEVRRKFSYADFMNNLS